MERGLVHMKETGPLNVLAGRGSFSFDGFSGKNKWREDHFAVETAEAFTAINKLLDRELQDTCRVALSYRRQCPR